MVGTTLYSHYERGGDSEDAGKSTALGAQTMLGG
jgi:hypothetical protein